MSRKAISEFFHALDQQWDSDIGVFGYGQHQHWQPLLPCLLEKQILVPITRKTSETFCLECGESVCIKRHHDNTYYHCAACGDVRRLPEEKVVRYQFSFSAFANDLAHGLGIEPAPFAITSERLWKLGTKAFRAGQFTLYLARGMAWEEGGSIDATAVPVQVKGMSVVLSFYPQEVAIPHERLIQVPLDAVISYQETAFHIEESLLAEKLWSIYSDIPAGKLTKERHQACSNWLSDRIADGTFRAGDKLAAFEIAQQKFRLGRDALQEIWGKVVPEAFQRAGRPKKSS